MTREQQLFIRVLADHIHGRPSAPPEGLDWEKLAEYAEEQALSGLIYLQTRDFFQKHPDAAPGVAERLHRGFYSDVYLYANRGAELKEFARRCGDVPMVLIKGSVVQNDYPVPPLRSMGDVDLVIHTEDRAGTDAVLLAAGYRKMVTHHAVWSYEKDRVEFEIHDHMVYDQLTNHVDYQAYFDQIWEHVHPADGTANIYIPEKDFHFLYLITHLAKHIINSGMGFRTFLDLVFTAQRSGEQMDWNRICGELDKLKLLKFAKICSAFCRRWFDVQLPIEPLPLDEGFFEEATAKMFNDGVFGLDNAQNEAARSARELRRSDRPYWRAALSLVRRQLFPSYREMQLVPWYRFLDGRPWLLPAAWVYRWFYTAVHKFRQSRERLTEPFAKRDIIEKRQKFMDGWGL